jgi:hypothetical protein
MSLWSRSPRALRFCEMTRLAAATTTLLSSGACTITFWCWFGFSHCALMLSIVPLRTTHRMSKAHQHCQKLKAQREGCNKHVT